MTPIKKPESPADLREMFQHISGSYDLMNRLISLGQDQAWRSYVVKMAAPPTGGRLLDIGAGTGNIARQALSLDPALRVAAADFSLDMMLAGRRRPGSRNILWCNADAMRLPFPDCTFDAVTSGYLIRNVSNARKAMEEQVRLVKPGGRVVCLDTSPPGHNLLRPLILAHMKYVIPILGQVIARNRAAYEYLPRSTRAFMAPEELASLMRHVGLQKVTYRRFMLGTQVVLSGTRPEKNRAQPNFKVRDRAP